MPLRKYNYKPPRIYLALLHLYRHPCSQTQQLLSVAQWIERGTSLVPRRYVARYVATMTLRDLSWDAWRAWRKSAGKRLAENVSISGAPVDFWSGRGASLQRATRNKVYWGFCVLKCQDMDLIDESFQGLTVEGKYWYK